MRTLGTTKGSQGPFMCVLNTYVLIGDVNHSMSKLQMKRHRAKAPKTFI